MIELKNTEELLIINNLIKEKEFFEVIDKIYPRLKEIISNVGLFSIDIEMQLPFNGDDAEYGNEEWELKNIKVKIGKNEDIAYLNLNIDFSADEEFIKNILLDNFYNDGDDYHNLECHIERDDLFDEEYLNKIISVIINNDKILQRIENNQEGMYSEDISKGVLFSDDVKKNYILEMNEFLNKSFCDLFYNIMNSYQEMELDYVKFVNNTMRIKFKDERNDFEMFNSMDEETREILKKYHFEKYKVISCFFEYFNQFKELDKLSSYDFLEKVYPYYEGFSFVLNDKNSSEMIKSISKSFRKKDLFVHYMVEKEKEFIKKNITPEDIQDKIKKRL